MQHFQVDYGTSFSLFFGGCNIRKGLVDIWMQKDSNRSSAVRSIRREESKDSVHSDDEDQIDEAMEKSMDPIAKRVVFGGTYPIDRPLTLKFGAAGAASSRRQQMNLTVKTPRTFAIDEPIREDNSVEVRSVPIGSFYQHPSRRFIFQHSAT